MIDEVWRRLRRARRTITGLTVLPLLVGTGILLSAFVAQLLAWPGQVVFGMGPGPVLLVALLPALARRRFWPTGAALVAVVGWLLATSWYDEPIRLWRLLGLAMFLYLMHSLCALAALLPFDAVVDPAVLARWLGQALLVTLAGAVLSILLLAAAGRTGGTEFSWAALLGLVVAVLATALLSWLLRRRQP